jgi:hypothetical protein
MIKTAILFFLGLAVIGLHTSCAPIGTHRLVRRDGDIIFGEIGFLGGLLVILLNKWLLSVGLRNKQNEWWGRHDREKYDMMRARLRNGQVKKQ